MTIFFNEEIPLKSWDKLCQESPYATPFQTPLFYSFINRIPGYSAKAVAVSYKNDLVGLSVVTFHAEPGIKACFSRRAIVYGGLVLAGNKSEILDALLVGINAVVKSGCIYAEIRNLNDYGKFSEDFARQQWVYKPWLNFQLPLLNTSMVKKQMSESRLRQIKKAIKAGVTWSVAEKEIEVCDFYQMLKQLYAVKIKKPLPPLDFFIAFFHSGVGKYLLVRHENRIIGGIMCPILPGKTIYEYYVCGLDREYKELYPSVMATFAAIEYGLQHNIPLFDFMGAGNPAQSYGVREFKARFGGYEAEHGRFLKINNKLLYFAGRLAINLQKYLK